MPGTEGVVMGRWWVGLAAAAVGAAGLAGCGGPSPSQQGTAAAQCFIVESALSTDSPVVVVNSVQGLTPGQLSAYPTLAADSRRLQTDMTISGGNMSPAVVSDMQGFLAQCQAHHLNGGS